MIRRSCVRFTRLPPLRGSTGRAIGSRPAATISPSRTTRTPASRSCLSSSLAAVAARAQRDDDHGNQPSGFARTHQPPSSMSMPSPISTSSPKRSGPGLGMPSSELTKQGEIGKAAALIKATEIRTSAAKVYLNYSRPLLIDGSTTWLVPDNVIAQAARPIATVAAFSPAATPTPASSIGCCWPRCYRNA